MKYIKDNKVYDNVRVVELDGRTIINPSHETILKCGYLEFNEELNFEEQLKKIKEEKIEELNRYDVSSNVNIFYYNGVASWLDKATRVGLANAIYMLEMGGKETIDVWMGETPINLTLAQARYLLSQIEIYALECYNVTSRHKKNIDNLTTIEDVKSYDFTIGYPNKLELNV